MRRELLCRIVVLFGSVLAITVILTAEEPQKDPLREALEALNRDAAALRSQLEGGKPVASPKPVATPSTMAAPAGMAAPAMGRPVPSTPTKQANVALPPAATTSNHWAFQPVKAPAPPAVRDTAWPANDLDRFVLAKIEAAGLRPGTDADPAALCRRLYLDLTGLPPTADEAAEFVQQGEKGYAALVDKLLASPRFGERWARHWLDVVRYADSVGRSWNAPFTYAWRYRDYVIDAFNADAPYDRFVAEQLAGDLLSSSDVAERRAQLTGLGFLGLGSLDLRGDTFQMDQIDDQIDVTTRAFLGLTIACARCHDHKYDPVSMHDYYALAGIFQSTDTLPGQADRHHLGSGGYVDPERMVRLPSRGGAADNDSVVTGIHSMSDYQQAWSSNRNVRYTTDPNLAMGATEGEVGDCELRIRGEPYDYGPAVPRGELRIPSLPRLPPIPAGVSGRLELARWIGSRENPLTSRVMVNRVWRHLFGRGLVPTVDDFGTTGEAPTHPELLDRMAADFAGDGWSQKRLIRTIVLSRTYRLASSSNAAGAAIDPDNRLYWRQNLRALELEPLRDSLLFVSGRLESERPYGIQVTGAGGKQGNRSLLGIDAPYRTIYLPVMRSLVPDVYGTFDFPDPTQIKGSRDSTTIAPQALFLMNDRFAVDCARSAAERLLDRTDLDDAGRVRLAYLQMYGRPPASAETAAALALIEGLQPDSGSRDPQLYRWTALTQALLSGAEFRFVR